jgi:hypothetical protein
VAASQESRGELRAHAVRLTNQGSCQHGKFSGTKIQCDNWQCPISVIGEIFSQPDLARPAEVMAQAIVFFFSMFETELAYSMCFSTKVKVNTPEGSLRIN